MKLIFALLFILLILILTYYIYKNSSIYYAKTNKESLKDNPDVNFKLYYPPNSILYWNRTVGGDQHLRLLRFKQYMYETLREYPNVEIYDFQDVKEITFNLEYYKDSSHYSKEVCDKLIERMATKTDLLTDDNYLQKIENLSNQLQNSTLKEIREYSKK